MADPIKAGPGCDYKRVEEIIEKDPALSRFLGQKTVSVERRNGTVNMHSPELIALVDAMVVSGMTIQSCQKPQTLHFALKFFQGANKVAGVATTPATSAPPPAPTPPPPAPQPAPKAPAAKKEEPKRNTREEKSQFCAAIALANLAMSMLQLAEQYDTAPGAEKRHEKLNSLATEYEKAAKDHLEGCWDTSRKPNAKG